MKMHKNEDKQKELLIKIESTQCNHSESIIHDLDPKSILLLEYQAKHKFMIRLISLLTLFFGVIGFIIWFFFIP